VTKIPCGDAVLCVRNINPSDENSVLHNYYQHDGKAALRQHILNELLLVRSLTLADTRYCIDCE